MELDGSSGAVLALSGGGGGGGLIGWLVLDTTGVRKTVASAMTGRRSFDSSYRRPSRITRTWWGGGGGGKASDRTTTGWLLDMTIWGAEVGVGSGILTLWNSTRGDRMTLESVRRTVFTSHSSFCIVSQWCHFTLWDPRTLKHSLFFISTH